LPTTQVVRLLLEAGAGARGRSCYGGTPLYLACQSGDEEASPRHEEPLPRAR
jgi:hypothetical protein